MNDGPLSKQLAALLQGHGAKKRDLIRPTCAREGVGLRPELQLQQP